MVQPEEPLCGLTIGWPVIVGLGGVTGRGVGLGGLGGLGLARG